MKKCIITVILFANSIFGIEPSELVRLYRGSLTNDADSREFEELLTKNRNLLSELKTRMNGVELLLLYGVIDSVSATSGNLIITFGSGGLFVKHKGVIRETAEYVANNEALSLTPDNEVRIFDGHHAGVSLVPVSFKDKKKGFKVTHTFNASSFGDGMKRNTGYVALSDTPTEVSEEDAEMIMKDGEWKTVKEYHAIVERENRLHELWSEHIHKRREAEALLQGEELTNRLSAIEHEVKLERDRIESGEQAEDEPSEEKIKSATFWLYAIIPLCLLAALWLARKKRKRDSP